MTKAEKTAFSLCYNIMRHNLLLAFLTQKMQFVTGLKIGRDMDVDLSLQKCTNILARSLWYEGSLSLHDGSKI